MNQLSNPAATLQKQRPYSVLWGAIPILAGIADPFLGIFTTLLSIFRRLRIPARADTPARRRRGLTLILGGIEGPSRYSYAMAVGLLRSGYRGSVVRFRWNGGIPLLRAFRNLMDTAHHARQADRLAALIRDYRREHPEAPVSILAQSGGCWITLRLLEGLPLDARIDAAVLLAPSISPDYDPGPAAARCRHGLLSIGGPGDIFFLGLGTTLLGTSDRVHTPAAGWVGWHHHPPGFTELRWHPAWLRYGYTGNHTTSSAAAFVQAVVAPLLFERSKCLSETEFSS